MELSETKRTRPSFRYENEAAGSGARRVAGIDEAGRGPLAGPVVAAAVILQPMGDLPGLNDSKLLTAAARERLFRQIHECALAVAVSVVSPDTIDRINILQATRMAMTEAVANLTLSPDYLLIDGPIALDLDIPQRAIIKGDRLSLSVASASIIAKVTRDRIMRELHKQFPLYGFDRHKGYGTRAHLEAIKSHGPCPAHRKCFKGVK